MHYYSLGGISETAANKVKNNQKTDKIIPD